MNIDHDKFDALRRDFSQKCEATNIRLYTLWDEKNRGHINTDLDIQRSYQWTPEQEQEMWDTLLLKVRIPEFHAIMDGLVYNVCDGKQRFTCIFKILNNEISYKRAKARSVCQWLFQKTNPKTGKLVNCPEIFFKDLPVDLQNDIFNTTVTIAQYTNLTREEQIMLFRKINNGKPLSDFAKGLAAYYYMRTDYSQYVVNHPHIRACDFPRDNPENIEKMVIRSLLLCANEDPIDLTPKKLANLYDPFNDEIYMTTFKDRLLATLDRIPNLPAMSRCSSWESIVPFILWGVYRHPELTQSQIGNLCNSLSDYHSGTHKDVTSTRCAELKQYIETLITSIKGLAA